MVAAMQYPASRPQTSGVFLRLKTWLSSKGIASRIILSVVGITIGVVLLVQLFSTIDFSEAPAQLRTIGFFGFALALLPYTFIAIFDTTAWRRLLPTRISFLKIFNIRSATEALVIAAPMGSVLSDPAKAWMLKRRFNIPLSQSTASIVLRKFLLGFGEGLVALGVATAAWFFASELGVSNLPTGFLSALTLAGGIMMLLGLLFTLFVSNGSFTRSAHRLLLRVRIAPLQRWLLAQEARFEELHQDFARLGREGVRDVIVAATEYIILWLLELVETYVILRLLRVDISFTQASAIEAACTIARAVAFMVPGGVGVQDTGYASLLLASGVHSPSVAAFILLKRLREALWAALGFSLLFIGRSSIGPTVSLIHRTDE
jgi:glycosyltransferase 2 family protein